jgi:hypothetical protein
MEELLMISDNKPSESNISDDKAYIAEHNEDIGEDVLLNNLITGSIAHALFALDQETQSDEGTNYKKLYYGMFNGVTEILRNTTTYKQTVAALRHLQCLAEDAFIAQAE